MKKKHGKDKAQGKVKGHKKNASISGGVIGSHTGAAASSHHEFLTNANVNIQNAPTGGQSQQLLKGTGPQAKGKTQMMHYQGSGVLDPHARQYFTGLSGEIGADGVDSAAFGKGTIEPSQTSFHHHQQADRQRGN